MKEIAAIAAPKTGKPVKHMQPAKGEECLVHDGKRIIVRHGPEAVTGCGNSAYTMLCGTPKELDVEVARVGLVAGHDAVELMVSGAVVGGTGDTGEIDGPWPVFSPRPLRYCGHRWS